MRTYDPDNLCQKIPEIKTRPASESINRRVVSTSDSIHTIKSYVFKENDFNVQRTDIYSNESLWAHVFIKLRPDDIIAVDNLFVFNNFNIYIVRFNSTASMIALNIDTGIDLKLAHWDGDATILNDSYAQYCNCFKYFWEDLIHINEDLFFVRTVGKDGNYCYFCRFDIPGDADEADFVIVKSEDIKTIGDVDVSIKNNIFIIKDEPGYNRIRYYTDNMNFNAIIRIIDRTGSDIFRTKNVGEIIDSSMCQSPLSMEYSKDKNYCVKVIKSDYVVVQVTDCEEDSAVLIFYEITCGRLIMNFSQGEKDSRYFVIKKAKPGDEPIVVELSFMNVYEVQFNDNVLKYDTYYTDICVSDSGRKIFTMGKITNRIPYFSVFNVDEDLCSLKRLKNIYSTDYSSDTEGFWDFDNLYMTTKDNDNIIFKIEKDSLIKV